MLRRSLCAVLLLAGCASYDPPVAADRGSARYQADLARCHRQAEKRADQVANASPSSAVKALFTSDAPEHQDETRCMVSRGYKPVDEPGVTTDAAR